MHRTLESAVRSGISGLLAVAAGVAAGELAAVPLSAFASPFQAVAAFLVDHSPAPAREWAITTFGTNDKPALMVGMGIAIVVISVIAGLLQTRRPPIGAIIVALFAVFGVIAAMTRPTASITYAIPSVVAGVVSVLVIVVLCRGSRIAPADEGAADEVKADEEATADAPRGWSRRAFFATAGLIAVASAASVVIARKAAQAGGVLAQRARLTLPRPTSTAAPIPAGTQLDVPGVTSFVTSNADFYRIDTALQVPMLSTDDWQLRIHGMVDREITLDWGDLMSMQAQERIITMTCVSNEVGGDLAGTARWLGFPMRDILSRVGPQDDADMLLSTSVDGWTSGTPLEVIGDGRDAMLVIGMNGEPLPVEHGYPVRQVIPGLYGYVSGCKWVIDWEITRFDRAKAYWTQRGWGVKGPIKTASRIDRPAPLSIQPPGPVVIAGTAWAQHRGIEKVEVRVDDGQWETATLATQYSTDTWRQWKWTWPATEGQHTIYCRATDLDGNTQPEERVAPIPDGATGWHSRVLRIEG